MANDTPESDFSIECFQNYSAPEVFVQGLAGMVNQSDVETVIRAQKNMLQRFEKTTEMLTNCNQLSASRLRAASAEFKKHTQLLLEMRKDLEFIFKKLRAIKTKLSTQYPEAYKSAVAASIANRRPVDEEDDEDFKSSEPRTESKMVATVSTETLKPTTSESGKKSKKKDNNSDESNQNPHLMRQDKSQYQFKVNLWTGILNGKVIGPFELQGNLDGDSYLNFLQNDLQILLEDVPLSDLQNMWFQNDGCPAHYARPVREYLNQEYPGRWIGRLGPILWPPRSPDLNPLDFFYWGCLKDRIYATPITTLDELRQKISEAAAHINRRRYARSIKRSFLRRCRACINAGGKQFEHLL